MTRYPASGKGGTWTALELKAISVDSAGDRLSDSGGLSGEVRVSNKGKVTIPFRYAFKWQGKVSWYYCGLFPQDSISTIRKVRDDAKNALRIGIDPRDQKKADKVIKQNQVKEVIEKELREAAEKSAEIENNLSFRDLYDMWVRDGVSRADNNKYISLTFEKHALPIIGKIPLKDLSEHDLRSLYRKIILSGRIATAVELSKDIGQMLRWGEKRKPWRALLIDGNPSALVEIQKLVPKDYSKDRKRLLSANELRKLKFVFDDSAQRYEQASKKVGVERPLKKEVQLAMWICLSTLCRIGELLMSEWKHLDFERKTWFIPADNVKGERGAKRDQIVFLSDFALDQFKALYSLTGESLWVFPARYKEGHVCVKSASKQIGDRQVKFKSRTRKLKDRVENNSLVLDSEFEWTPHDLRRTGATMMQQLQISRDVINLCQNHVIGSKVDRVYLLDDYAEQKKVAWVTLGRHLEEILK